MFRYSRWPVRLLAVVISISGAGSGAHAADRFWGGRNPGSGTFSNVNSWAGGNVAGPNDIAHFGLTDSNLFTFAYTVGFDVSPQNQAFLVEDDLVTFDLNGHTYFTTATTGDEIGNVAGRTGLLKIIDGIVATSNIGTTGTVQIGSVASATGSLIVSSGGRLTGAAPFFPPVIVGATGNGNLTVDSSGKVESSSIEVASAPGSTGTATITGSSASADASFVRVGFQGTGTLNVTAGGLLNNICSSCAGLSSVIGNLQAGVGTVNVDGANSRWINTLGIELGDRGQATVNITAGGRVESGGGLIAADAIGHGTVNVDGANSVWANSASLTLGQGGVGSLHITGGGSVSDADATIGGSAGSTGTATVAGAGSQWDSAGFFVGSSGHGTVNVTAGGHLNTANAVIGVEMGSVGEVTVDGAGSTWTSSSFIFVSSFGPGTGTLTVANGGTVSTQSGLSVRLLGTLRGDGQIIGNVSNIGVVAPGLSPGALHVMGNFTQGVQGKLEIELAGTMAGQFDQLLGSGTASLAGTLAVSLTGGFTPSAGDTFEILSATGGVTGTFANNLLPALPGGLFFNDVQYGAKTVTLNVGGVLGDYNHNGVVDAADYTVWRDTLGRTGTGLTADGNGNGMVDAADFNVWKSNFGQTAGSGSVASAAVPEPASLLLLLSGTLAICSHRCKMGPKLINV